MLSKKILPLLKKTDHTKLDLRPFTLVLFKSFDASGKLITSLQKFELGEEADEFSHVGMIVTTEILSHPNMIDGVKYIFESTASGKLGGNVYNIDGKAWIGTQLRVFDDVLQSYTSNGKNLVAIRTLKNNPLDTMDIHILREKFAYIFGKYNDMPYEINIMQLFAAMFPCLRCFRIGFNKKRFIFCSELVAIVYKHFNILDRHCDQSNVVPADFYVSDEDNCINLNIFNEIIYVN